MRHHSELNNKTHKKYWQKLFTTFSLFILLLLVALLILVVPFIEIHVEHDDRSRRQSCQQIPLKTILN